MNFEERDKYGMYKGRTDFTAEGDRGPGPQLMGADTFIGIDVYNTQNGDLGDIKRIMLDTASGKVASAVLSFGGFLGVG